MKQDLQNLRYLNYIWTNSNSSRITEFSFHRLLDAERGNNEGSLERRGPLPSLFPVVFL